MLHRIPSPTDYICIDKSVLPFSGIQRGNYSDFKNTRTLIEYNESSKTGFAKWIESLGDKIHVTSIIKNTSEKITDGLTFFFFFSKNFFI